MRTVNLLLDLDRTLPFSINRLSVRFSHLPFNFTSFAMMGTIRLLLLRLAELTLNSLLGSSHLPDVESEQALESNFGTILSQVYLDLVWLTLHSADRLEYQTDSSVNRAQESISNELLNAAQKEIGYLMTTQQARLAKKIANPDEHRTFFLLAKTLSRLFFPCYDPYVYLETDYHAHRLFLGT